MGKKTRRPGPRSLGRGALAPLLWVLAATLPIGACAKEAPQAPPCTHEPGEAAEVLPRGPVWLRLEAGDAPDAPDALAQQLRGELPRYLRALWGRADAAGGEPALDVVTDGRTPAAPALTIWVSSAEDARSAAGPLAAGLRSGYVLRRLPPTDPGAGASPVLLVYARTSQELAFGAYALLEELGVRFFHPMHEYVPHLPDITVPRALSALRTPAVRVRGTQLHTLHPIEYFDSFMTPGPGHLAEAERVVDWLIKTGQNHIQWWLFKTFDWAAYKPHARAILDYAHARGVTVAALVQLHCDSSLQNSRCLVDAPQGWEQQLERGLDAVLELPWDGIELAMGEFFASDPAGLLAWLDHATAYVAAHHPEVHLSVINHVGEYPNLHVEYQGRPEYYYFLPRYADRRLTTNVHTVMWNDLYRDWGAYGHRNFFAHREFLLEQLAVRPVRYQPESAYWVTADIDVPVFLPHYLYARHLDIQNLTRDIAQRGLPALEGHVLFSSGHEWGYWLTDYLTAKMLWAPERPLGDFLALGSAHYGRCAEPAAAVLTEYLALQTAHLFDGRLMPYLSGEDLHDDLTTALGKVTHPPRVPFETVLGMSAAERAAFRQQVLAGLQAFADASGPLLERQEALCRRMDAEQARFCAELVDGIAVTQHRARYVRALYGAILARAEGGEPAGALRDADASLQAGRVVIERRAAGYRFPLERLTGVYDNPSLYKFGYLRQAHNQCLWHRQRAQVDHLLETGQTPSPFRLPLCTE